MRRLVVGMACTLVASFSWIASAQEGPKDPKELEVYSPVYPLKEGNTWVYALGKKEVTITVGPKEKREIVRKDELGKDMTPELVRCFRLHTVSEDKKLTEIVGVVKEGVYRFESAGKAIKPPLCFFHFKSPSWECKSESNNVQLSGTFTRRQEAVTVPYSPTPLNAFKISCPDFKIGDQSMAIDSWFVTKIGMVKQRVKLENHDPLVLELKEFREGK